VKKAVLSAAWRVRMWAVEKAAKTACKWVDYSVFQSVEN
jgi:CRISPR/Cas system-associated endoribonuclease Cas2